MVQKMADSTVCWMVALWVDEMAETMVATKAVC